MKLMKGLIHVYGAIFITHKLYEFCYGKLNNR